MSSRKCFLLFVRFASFVVVAMVCGTPPVRAESQFNQQRDQCFNSGKEKGQVFFKATSIKAESGDVNGMTCLSILYDRGLGVTRNAAESAKWAKLGADKGSVVATFGYGYLLVTGDGVSKDIQQGIQFITKAAEQGYERAQYYLGSLYWSGTGVPKNMTEVARWFRAAAEQGHAEAQYYLGVLYLNGGGVQKSQTDAAKWFRAAAEQGHTEASKNLALEYYLGDGVEQDMTEANKWFEAAAQHSGIYSLITVEGKKATSQNQAPASCTVDFSVQKTFIGRPDTDVARQEQRYSDGQFNRDSTPSKAELYDLDYSDGFNYITSLGNRDFDYRRSIWKTYYMSDKTVVGFKYSVTDHPRFYEAVEFALPWFKSINWDSIKYSGTQVSMADPHPEYRILQSYRATKLCDKYLIEIDAEWIPQVGKTPSRFGQLSFRSYRIFDAQHVHQRIPQTQ